MLQKYASTHDIYCKVFFSSHFASDSSFIYFLLPSFLQVFSLPFLLSLYFSFSSLMPSFFFYLAFIFSIVFTFHLLLSYFFPFSVSFFHPFTSPPTFFLLSYILKTCYIFKYIFCTKLK